MARSDALYPGAWPVARWGWDRLAFDYPMQHDEQLKQIAMIIA